MNYYLGWIRVVFLCRFMSWMCLFDSKKSFHDHVFLFRSFFVLVRVHFSEADRSKCIWQRVGSRIQLWRSLTFFLPACPDGGGQRGLGATQRHSISDNFQFHESAIGSSRYHFKVAFSRTAWRYIFKIAFRGSTKHN